MRGRCDPYKDPIPEIPPETLIEFAGKYVALFETVTGLSFDYGDPAMPVRDRVQASLARAFPDYF